MKAWVITKKDLRLLVRDRRALAVLLFLPLIFITIIGLTTGKLLGWQSRNQRLRIAVVDEVAYDQIGSREFNRDDDQGNAPDSSATSPADGASPADSEDEDEATESTEEDKRRDRKIARNLVVKLMNRLQQRRGIDVLVVEDLEEAVQLYQTDEATAALVIGPDFYRRITKLSPEDILEPSERKLASGLSGLDIRLEAKSTSSSTYSVIEQLVWADALATIAPGVLCRNRLIRRRMRARCAALDAEADAPPIAVEPIQPHATEANSELYQQLVPSYTVMFVFFLVNIMARSFIHERDLGTLRRLRIAPLSEPSLLAGKTIPFFILSLVQTALLFVCGYLLFGMSWGNNPWLLLPVVAATSLSATALGLLVATWARTESQVSAYANIVVITMAGISGCFMPREWLPDTMRTISLGTPHAWALIAYHQILRNDIPDLSIVLKSCGVLVGMSLLFFLVGCQRFRRLD